MRLGFTAWVELRRTSTADVRAYSRGLDRHLAGRDLVRSLNPLDMLVWSPTRSATLDDQVELLSWLALETQAECVYLSGLRTHVGIPALRGREPLLQARLSDPRSHAVFVAYRLYEHSPAWALEQFRQPAANHT
jgi:hypothetical protein